MANVRKVLGKTLAFLLVFAMVFGMMPTALADRGGRGDWGGGYVLDERYYDGDRDFGWDTYEYRATLLDENGRDVYDMIEVSVGGVSLEKGDTSREVSNQDVVDHGVTISNIPAGYYISAYKIVCVKYACYTDHAGNATDEQVSLDAGQGSYHVSVEKKEMGHANVGASAYYILIELSAFKIEDEETVTYPYKVMYNYGELADELAGQPDTVDSNTYVYNSTATILSPNAEAEEAAMALGYKFVGWEIEKVEGILAITGVVGTRMNPSESMTVTGETTLKALWERVPIPAISVDKTADGETYEIGEIVTWTIVVTNTSEFTAYDVVVTDSIPAGLKLVEGEASVTIDQLVPGATETVTVKTEVVEAGIHTNSAAVAWKNAVGDPFESDPATDTVIGEEPIPETPVVVVDKTADGSTFEVGEIVTWTIVVTNTSEFTAYNVVVTDSIPAGLKLVEGEASVTIDQLVPGATETVTVKTEVVEAGIHTNSAAVAWKNAVGDPFESDPATDTVIGEEPIPETPVVVVDKTADGSTFEVGEIVTWTIVVTNTSEFTAYNVVVTDNIPAGLELVEGEAVTVIDELAPGATETVTVKTKVVEAGVHTNTALVSWENVEGIGSEGDPSEDTVTAEEPPVYTLTVHYVDTKGNKLAESIVMAELAENSAYTTEQKSFTGYTFVKITGDAVKGIMDGDKEVTYVYDLNEYTLIVNYVDTEGNKLTEAIVTAGLAHGSEYATEQKSFTGYTCVETTGDAVKGIMDGDKEVTYVYDLNEYTLIVNYVDTEGNKLTESIVIEGLAHGSEYATEQKSFAGYTFVNTSGDAAEGIMDSDKEVTYVYELNEYTLTVHYMDTEGNQLANTIVAVGLPYGSKYATEQKSFTGYTLVETTGDAVSGIMDSDKEVTYVYDLNEYTLIVRYVDTDGNELAETDITEGLAHGTEYNTVAEHIVGYDCIRIWGDARKGIMDSDKEVVYIYAPVQTPPPAGENPDGDIPDEDIPDEDVPLTDIPDEDVPKTGDPLALMIAAAAASGLGVTGLVIRRKKEDEE